MNRSLTAILVDDEKSSREVLKELLSVFCPEVRVTGEASSVAEAFRLIREQQPQLVFLDVQMPTGNGFSLLQRFGETPFDVIFVTGFDEYAIRAIRCSALDYLLKPIDINLLREAVRKAMTRHAGRQSNLLQIGNLLHSLDAEIPEQKVALHKQDHVHLVKLRDILYLEGDSNYSQVITSTEEKYSSSKTLKEWEELLQNSGLFLRLHRGVLVNTSHIARYSKGDPCQVALHNGTIFEISRRKKTEMLDRLKGRLQDPQP